MNKEKTQTGIAPLLKIAADPHAHKIDPYEDAGQAYRPCLNKMPGLYINDASRLTLSTNSIIQLYADNLAPTKDLQSQFMGMINALASHLGIGLDDLVIYGHGHPDQWYLASQEGKLNLRPEAVQEILEDLTTELEERIRIIKGRGRSTIIQTRIQKHLEETAFDQPTGLTDTDLAALFTTAQYIRAVDGEEELHPDILPHRVPSLASNHYEPMDFDSYRDDVFDTLMSLDDFIAYAEQRHLTPDAGEQDKETDDEMDDDLDIEYELDDALPQIADALQIHINDIYGAYGIDPEDKFAGTYNFDNKTFLDNKALTDIMKELVIELEQALLIGQGQARTHNETKLHQYLTGNPFKARAPIYPSAP